MCLANLVFPAGRVVRLPKSHQYRIFNVVLSNLLLLYLLLNHLYYRWLKLMSKRRRRDLQQNYRVRRPCCNAPIDFTHLIPAASNIKPVVQHSTG